MNKDIVPSKPKTLSGVGRLQYFFIELKNTVAAGSLMELDPLAKMLGSKICES